MIGYAACTACPAGTYSASGATLIELSFELASIDFFKWGRVSPTATHSQWLAVFYFVWPNMLFNCQDINSIALH